MSMRRESRSWWCAGAGLRPLLELPVCVSSVGLALEISHHRSICNMEDSRFYKLGPAPLSLRTGWLPPTDLLTATQGLEKTQQAFPDLSGGARRKPLIHRHALNGDFQVGRFSTSVVVQPQSRAPLFATPWTAARQASLSSTISQRLLKLLHLVGDAIQPSHPLLPTSPFAFSPLMCVLSCSSRV